MHRGAENAAPNCFERPAKIRVAPHGTGPEQCLVLPGPGVLPLVEIEGVDSRHEKSALAIGPQAHIHFIETPGRRVHGEQMHDALPQAQEEHDIVERTLALGLLNGTARIVQKHQIKIGAIPEFQTSQLAVTGDGHPYRPQSRFRVAAVGDAIGVRHLLPGQLHTALNDEFGDVGEPVTHLHQRQPPRQIGERHRENGHLLELPQCLDLPFRIIRGQPLGARGECPHETLARRQFIERLGIDQLVQQQREIGNLPRQKPLMAQTSIRRFKAGGCSLSKARYDERVPMASSTRSTRCTTVADRGSWQPPSAGGRG